MTLNCDYVEPVSLQYVNILVLPKSLGKDRVNCQGFSCYSCSHYESLHCPVFVKLHQSEHKECEGSDFQWLECQLFPLLSFWCCVQQCSVRIALFSVAGKRPGLPWVMWPASFLALSRRSLCLFYKTLWQRVKPGLCWEEIMLCIVASCIKHLLLLLLLLSAQSKGHPHCGQGDSQGQGAEGHGFAVTVDFVMSCLAQLSVCHELLACIVPTVLAHIHPTSHAQALMQKSGQSQGEMPLAAQGKSWFYVTLYDHWIEAAFLLFVMSECPKC